MILLLVGLSGATEWSAEEHALLESGAVVWRSTPPTRGWVEGEAAILVDTSAEQLLAIVADYDAYVAFLPYVTASQTLSSASHEDGIAIRSRYELTTRGIKTSFTLENLLNPAQGTMTFRYTDGPGNIEKGGHGVWQTTSWTDQRQLLTLSMSLPDQWWLPRGAEQQIAAIGLPTLVQEVAERALMLPPRQADPSPSEQQ